MISLVEIKKETIFAVKGVHTDIIQQEEMPSNDLELNTPCISMGTHWYPTLPYLVGFAEYNLFVAERTLQGGEKTDWEITRVFRFRNCESKHTDTTKDRSGD